MQQISAHICADVHRKRAKLSCFTEHKNMHSCVTARQTIKTLPHVGSRAGAVSPFPAPAASNCTCGFPAYSFPIHFLPRLMWPIVPEVLSPLVEACGHSSHRKVPIPHITISYSTFSSQSLYVVGYALVAVALSFPPNRG